MIKYLLSALLLVCGLAQADTTANLITGTWNNVTNGSHPNNCCTGGPGPLYDSSTNTIHFSYGLTAVHQVQAINQALSNSGVQINGWNWGYDLRNMNGVAGNQNGTDSIAVTSFITNSAGQIVQQSDQHYNTRFDWTRYTGTVNLNTALSDYGSLGIQFVANDGGYWAGYYGPQVRDVSLTANYTVDQCTVNPQSSPSCPGYKTYYNMWDDGYAVVPLPFAFPFYDQVFTTSYMYTNGVVGFLNNNWGFCCDGTDLNGQTSQQNSPWNYAIYALNTDLIPGPNSEFYTQVTDNGTGLKYSWVNVPEIGTSLNNTFSVQIKDTGYIGLTYDQVNLNPWRNPLVGIAGNIAQGQYSISYFGQASSLPNLPGTTIMFTGTETTDICAINPLYSNTCPGYAAAYLSQQCSINSLYDTSCPGYAAAYYTQQCSINSLYDVGCPGYAAAYLDYQCSLNPLYATQCVGYEQAYFDQQCSLDGLYDKTCPNYAKAYALKYVVVETPTTTTVTTSQPTEVAVVSDPVVNNVITTTTTSTTSPTATVQLTAPVATTTTVAAANTTTESTAKETKDDMVSETPTQENTASSSASSSESNGKSDSGGAKPTARQELAAKRREAAKQAAVAAGTKAAEEIGTATSLEAQVAVQNVVIAAMGFTPGFQAYNVVMPDGVGYKPFTVYNNQKNVDNRRLSMGLTGPSDRLHEAMIAAQWEK